MVQDHPCSAHWRSSVGYFPGNILYLYNPYGSTDTSREGELDTLSYVALVGLEGPVLTSQRVAFSSAVGSLEQGNKC